MEFKKYIKAVGTGPKGNRELSYDESIDMMNQILDKKVPSELVSAFLLGWRLKPETITEYRGALYAMNSRLKQTKIENSIELGFPFDGKAINPFLFPLVARILEKKNINLVVMGDERIPAKNGVTVKDICTHISLPKNVHYFDRLEYCKEMNELTFIRNLLGVRSAFNTLEKLPHLGLSQFAITGVFHKPYVQKYCDIFKGQYETFSLIQANEGAPELLSKAKLWVYDGENLNEQLIDPAFYGITYEKSEEGISIEDSLKIYQDPSRDMQKLACLNAAIYLFVSKKIESIEQGMEELSF